MSASELLPWINSAGEGGVRNSMQEYPGNGTDGPWEFNFAGPAPGYIDQSHVKAYRYDPVTAITYPQTLTFLGPNQVTTSDVIPTGQFVVVYRDTPKDKPLVDYTEGSVMNEVNLDMSNEQAVYAAAEMIDRFDAVNETSSDAAIRAAQAYTQSLQAQTDAASALSASTAAQTASAQALTTANSASSVANAIDGKAQTALDQSGAAVTTANSAASVANAIDGKAQSALDASASAVTQAGAAVSAANSAVTQAQAATTTANGIDSKAQTALDNSTTALSTANAASTTANAVDAKAQAASDSAAAAQTYAAQAPNPVLNVMWFVSRSAIPTGWVPLDGGTYQRSTYPTAWAAINAGQAPTVADASWLSDPTQRMKFTTGDGSTTFRVPDYNAKYDTNSLAAVVLRGDGAGSAGTAGALQRDQFQGSSQYVQLSGGTGSGLHAGANGTTGGAYYLMDTSALDSTALATGSTYKALGSYGTPRVGSETRMSNVTGVYAIKLAGAAINAGNLDLTQLTSNMLDRRNNLGDVLDKAAARANLQLNSRIDLSTLSSDVELEVGQTGYFNCAALSSVPFHVALGDRQRYKLVWHRSDAALGSNVPNMGILQINNTTYASRFFTVHKGYGNGAFSGSTGYTDGVVLGAAGYCWDAFEATIITDITHKWMVYSGRMRSGGVNYSWSGDCRMVSTANAGDTADTTTAWTSLGTWVAGAGTLTGTFTITREL